MKQLLSVFLICVCSFAPAQEIISNAISASDHKRSRPLMEAVEAGFAGVSADLTLGKDGVLKCGNRSFEELYLKPLMNLSQQNNGHIYQNQEDEFFLVMNVESDSVLTYSALEKLVGIYPDLFSRFDNGVRSKKAVRLILSGNVPVNAILSSTVRWAFPDENIKNIRTELDGRYIAMSTMNYKKIFDWNGEQNMPNMAYMSFLAFVKNAHKAGRLVRIKNAPENANAMGIFLEAGADFIEVKDIPAFVKFYKSR